MSVRIEVWGDYACFSRPELKTERVSYDVMTPSAARGIVEAILWHPGLRWHIDKIYVRAPIRFTNIRRNEVKDVVSGRKLKTIMEKGSGEAYIATSESIQQRAAMVLKDVHYVIEAHFDMTEQASASDNPAKFQQMVKRRAEKGQCYHQPCFGCREFPANFREWPGGSIPALKVTQDLGFMLHSLDYSDSANIRSQFFRAKLVDGVMECRDVEVFT